jgi:hypothetical protein
LDRIRPGRGGRFVARRFGEERGTLQGLEWVTVTPITGSSRAPELPLLFEEVHHETSAADILAEPSPAGRGSGPGGPSVRGHRR